MTTIALTGKGGTGKTTIAAFMLSWLVTKGKTPVLAVDADSNANFNELLGVSYSATVGGIREDARKQASGSGTSKQRFLEMRVNEALVESKGFDLIVMGRPEGPGCYCFANNVLRDVIARLSGGYPHVIVDCEAGLEHLSRRTLLEVDWLFTVSDPSIRGLRTARRVAELLEEMKTRVRNRALIINRLEGVSSDFTKTQTLAVRESGFDKVYFLPSDETVKRMDETGGTILDVPETSGMVQGVSAIMNSLFAA